MPWLCRAAQGERAARIYGGDGSPTGCLPPEAGSVLMKCPRCNHDNPEANRYCGQCGNLLQADLSGARMPVESERRVVTILFADISGFTAMSEELDAEEVTAIVNECFAALTEEIDKYGGVIDKYMGDAIMALFGAPTAHGNDPERAVHAALGMQAALAHFSERLERRAGVKFRMRIGVNTGPVVAGYVGSHIKSSYTVLGDAVNTAARIQSAAPEGSVLVNEPTRRLSQHIFDFEAKEPLVVKGKSEPLHVYEVRGVKQSRESQRGLRGILSPFVGRATEQRALRRVFDDVLEGRGQIISIIGEAGLGKSRLLYEFEQGLRESGYLRPRHDAASDELSGGARPEPAEGARLLYLKGRSVPYGQLNTYWVIGGILRRYLEVEDNAPADEVRLQLEQRAPVETVPLLGRFLSLHYPDERLDRLTAEQLKREMFDAFAAVFERESDRRPVVFVCEDMHWIDPSSLDLVRDLMRRVSARRIMFISLYRPEFAGLRDQVGAGSPRPQGRDLAEPQNLAAQHTLLALTPLSEVESRALIESLLAVADFPTSIKELITRKAGGNPFYVEEIIKSFIDSGLLVRAGERWRAGSGVADVKLPDTLQGVIMERIDSLEETAKRVLQQGAVIGNSFPQRVLENISDIEQQIGAHLDRLEHQDFLYRQTSGDDVAHTFKHLLSHEVAYDSMLIARRRLFHRRIGAYLETTYAEHLDALYDTLAHHFYRGGEWLKAIHYAQQAGRRAKALYANQEAVEYFSRIVEVAERLESGKGDILEGERQIEFALPSVVTRRREALSDRGDVRALIGQFDTAIADFQTALAIGGDAAGARDSADLYWRLGDVYDKKGQFDLALDTLQTGRALLEQLKDGAGQVEAARIYATLGWVYVRKGHYDLAEEMSHRGLALLDASAPPSPPAPSPPAPLPKGEGSEGGERALAHKTLGTVARRRGNLEEAIRHYELSRALSEQVGNIREIGRLHNNLANVYAQQGIYVEALAQLQRCLEVMQKIGDTPGIANTYNNLGGVYNLLGDYPNALKYHELSLKTRIQIGDAARVAQSHNNLGEVYRRLGEPERAIEHLQQGLQIARDIGWQDQLPEFHRQLAQAYLALGDLPRAKQYGEQALFHAQQLGQKLEEAFATRTLAAVAEEYQDYAPAEAGYRQTIELLGKVGAEQELSATHEALGRLLKSLNRETEALAHLRAAQLLCAKLGARSDEARVQTLIAGIAAPDNRQ